MFKNISWSSFITTIVVLVILYYMIIGILYYRSDVMRILNEGFKQKDKPAPDLPEQQGQSRGAMFSSVHELMDELKDLFFTATSKDYPKEELVTALHSKMQGYHSLKGTQFESAINTHIIQTVSSMCNCELYDTDIKRIW